MDEITRQKRDAVINALRQYYTQAGFSDTDVEQFTRAHLYLIENPAIEPGNNKTPTLSQAAEQQILDALDARFTRFIHSSDDSDEGIDWDEADQNCSETNCHKPATWVRATQFAGNHYFCDDHARKQENFGQKDPSYFFWVKLS